jgi:hypothetical protein
MSDDRTSDNRDCTASALRHCSKVRCKRIYFPINSILSSISLFTNNEKKALPNFTLTYVCNETKFQLGYQKSYSTSTYQIQVTVVSAMRSDPYTPETMGPQKPFIFGELRWRPTNLDSSDPRIRTARLFTKSLNTNCRFITSDEFPTFSPSSTLHNIRLKKSYLLCSSPSNRPCKNFIFSGFTESRFFHNTLHRAVLNSELPAASTR